MTCGKCKYANFGLSKITPGLKCELTKKTFIYEGIVPEWCPLRDRVMDETNDD